MCEGSWSGAALIEAVRTGPRHDDSSPMVVKLDRISSLPYDLSASCPYVRPIAPDIDRIQPPMYGRRPSRGRAFSSAPGMLLCSNSTAHCASGPGTSFSFFSLSIPRSSHRVSATPPRLIHRPNLRLCAVSVESRRTMVSTLSLSRGLVPAVLSTVLSRSNVCLLRAARFVSAPFLLYLTELAFLQTQRAGCSCRHTRLSRGQDSNGCIPPDASTVARRSTTPHAPLQPLRLVSLFPHSTHHHRP